MMSRRTPHRHASIGFTLVEIMAAIVIIVILAVITLSLGSALLERTDRRRTTDVLQLLDAAIVEYEQTTGRRLTYGERGLPLDNVNPEHFDAGQSGSVYDIEFTTNGLDQPGVGYPDPLSPGFPAYTVSEDDYRKRLGGQVGTANAPNSPLWRVLTRKLLAVESCRNILTNADSDLVMAMSAPSGSDVVESIFNDAWGSPILIVFPGRDIDTDFDDVNLPATLRDEDGTVRTRAERLLGPARNKRVFFISAGPDRRFGDLQFETQVGVPWDPDRTLVQMRRADDNLYSYEVRTW
jgi:prepilin-type N-terminal cleavage/methylation domain-containing protein